jgi:hypothetical protein
LRVELAAKIAVVTIVSNVQNARVLVRGVEVGKTPLSAPLRLEGGKESMITANLQPISDRGILVVRASTSPAP